MKESSLTLRIYMLCCVLLSMLAGCVGCRYLWVVPTHTELATTQAFQQESWQNQPELNLGISTVRLQNDRYAMHMDLLKNHRLHGKHYDELVAMLGEPDETRPVIGNANIRLVEYWMAYTPDYGASDIWLRIMLQNDVVIGVMSGELSNDSFLARMVSNPPNGQ